MRKRESNPKYKSTLGFSDMFLNLVTGFVFMLIIAIMLINPKAKQKVVDPKAEYMIIMTWPDTDTNDIDIWINTPQGSSVSFRSKDNGYVHLDRDDLGGSNDTMVIDGKKQTNPTNREVISIRQKIPGHYIVSGHWYSDKGTHSLDKVPVEFELIRVNPYKPLAKSTIILESKGAEWTAFQFDIDHNGDIDDITNEHIIWVQPKVAGFVNGTSP